MLKVRFDSLNQALEAAAQHAPKKGITFKTQKETQFVSHSALYEKSLSRAYVLKGLGVDFDSKVVISLEKNVDFAVTYFGILLCGAVPCVVAPSGSLYKSKEIENKTLKIATQIDARFLITTQPIGLSMPIKVINLQDIHASENASHTFQAKANELAIIQASSGSTGVPKCIALSQKNLLSNAEQTQISLAVTHNGDDIALSWAPFFHDMGLLGCFLFPLYWHVQQVHLTPFQFLRKPTSWLQAISDYRGTLSIGPNFAYKLVTQKTTQEAMENLDLTSWRSAMCGGEQIDVKTLKAFADKFAPCGFRYTAFAPSYGLAEASLGVSRTLPNESLLVEHISRQAYIQHQKAELISECQDGINVVSCGFPHVDTKIRIQDSGGRHLQDGLVGEIWVSSPSVMRGYINLPHENQKVLKGGWLDTGDVGYTRDSRLFITGRKKELIIIRGNNYMPTEFEWAAQEVVGIDAGQVVAFGLFDEQTATEQLYLVCARARGKISTQSDDDLASEVKAAVAKQTGVMPFLVSIVPRGFIRKTTSGKLRRLLAKEEFVKESTKITGFAYQRGV